jgi:hypothetical protein
MSTAPSTAPPLPPSAPVLGLFNAAEVIVGRKWGGKTRLAQRWIAEVRAQCAEENVPLIVVVVHPRSPCPAAYHELSDVVIEDLSTPFNGKPASAFITEWQKTRVARSGGAKFAPFLLVIDDLPNVEAVNAQLLGDFRRAGIDVVIVAQNADEGPRSESFKRITRLQGKEFQTWPPQTPDVLGASGIAVGAVAGPCGCASCAPAPIVRNRRHFYADAEPIEAAQFADLLKFTSNRAPPPILTADAVRARVFAQ